MESIAGQSIFLRFIGLVLYGTFAGSSVHAQQAPLETSHRRVQIIARPVQTGAYYDVDVISADQATERIRVALDLIEEKSSFGTSALKKLTKSGYVYIVYDPQFPPTAANRSGTRLATFVPDLDVEDYSRGAESYPILVGRYIVKWTNEGLASVLVHELVHGIQHKEGRLRTSSTLDMECEASLHQERALQNFGADKRSEQVVGLRRQLQLKSCMPFIQYMKANTPTKVELWNTLNPDVPQLISIFDKYQGTK